jgi:hypothetical protein
MTSTRVRNGFTAGDASALDGVIGETCTTHAWPSEVTEHELRPHTA